jgi:hypothetical protein
MSRAGIDSKFARARRLASELSAEVEGFLSGEPYRLEASEEPNGDLVYRVQVRAQPPIGWSVLIGDIVHNARSALDHLAYALVNKNGGTPDEHTYFPISDQPTGFGAKIRKSLHGASKESKDVIRALEPWQGGDDILWRLHRLDIFDKHQLLVPVGAAHGGILVDTTFMGFKEGDDPVRIPPYQVLSGDRQYPLQDRAEVFRIMKAGREPRDGPIRTDYSVVFEVAFGEGAIVQGEPLVPTLGDMVEHVASVVEPLVIGL